MTASAFRRRPYARLPLIAASCGLLVIIMLSFPPAAHAGILEDAAEMFHNMIKGILVSLINALYTKIFELIKAIGATSPLGSEWANIFGAGTGNAVLKYGTEICNGIVKPIGCGILTFVALIQMVKVSQRMDSNGTLPAVKEVLFLFVSLAVFTWLVNNVDLLLGGFYDVLNRITIAILRLNPSFSDTFGSIQFIAADASGSYKGIEYGDLLVAFIGAFAAFLFALIGYLIALVLAYARAIQLYAMMTFAPLPISFLGIDECRQWGVGFIKNFLSVCLAGAIMVFILLAFPFMVVAVLGSDASSNMVIDLTRATGTTDIAALIGTLKVAAVCLMLSFALIKSGSWARDILGG